MKKKNVINLIKYHIDGNDKEFRNEAYEIATDFQNSGDEELARYIMALLSNANTFSPQFVDDYSEFFVKMNNPSNTFKVPKPIEIDIMGILNAVNKKSNVNKFLFVGDSGTGKTEAAKQIARILDRELYSVQFDRIVDSKLGQTSKNLIQVFDDINCLKQPDKVIILFDEIDAISLDRTNQNDLREMGRATSTMLKCLDKMNENIVLVATTNLYEHFDKAVIRRFDSVIDFNRYNRDDLLMVAEKMLDQYLEKFKIANRDIRLFRKIINLYDVIPYPGELKNVIKTSIAFSSTTDGTDYFRRLYYAVCNEKPENLKKLKLQKFTIREIEILTQKSKSSVGRELKDGE